jgi:hypothetical protein
MKIQYVSKYLSLSEEGLVPRINCPVDQGSLLCNTDLEDQIALEGRNWGEQYSS